MLVTEIAMLEILKKVVDSESFFSNLVLVNGSALFFVKR